MTADAGRCESIQRKNDRPGRGGHSFLNIAAAAQRVQKRRAAEHEIVIRRAKVVRIPRVGDAALQARKRQQRSDLPVRVVREDAAEVARVVLVHRQQPVIGVVVARRDLHGGAVADRDAMGAQLGARGRVDVVADLLAARRRRGDLKLRREPLPPHHVSEQILRHGAAADVAVADE